MGEISSFRPVCSGVYPEVYYILSGMVLHLKAPSHGFGQETPFIGALIFCLLFVILSSLCLAYRRL